MAFVPSHCSHRSSLSVHLVMIPFQKMEVRRSHFCIQDVAFEQQQRGEWAQSEHALQAWLSFFHLLKTFWLTNVFVRTFRDTLRSANPST